jgi:threonine/homoserine/homoserine lactone efflux protein
LTARAAPGNLRVIMIDAITLLAFLPAAIALNLTPGPDMLFCLGQGLSGGPRAAIAADFGIATGGMLHTLASGLGLAALIAAWPAAFETIRWVGVAFLLWIVWRTLRAPLGRVTRPAVRPARAFRDGLVVNLTNPKFALFILAFLPQFVDPARGSVLGQFLILGSVLGIGGLIANGAVGVFAGGLGRALTAAPRIELTLRAITATLFFSLAARLALERR